MLYTLIRLAMYYPFRKVTEAEIVAIAEEQSNFMETVRGIQTIKLFGSEAKREGLWQNYYSTAINENIKLGKLHIRYSAISKFLFGVENIVVVYIAAKLVLGGGFSIGMLFAFMAYKQQFMERVTNLIEKLIEFKMLSLHFERIADIALTSKEELHSGLTNKHKIKGKIELKNICFRYSEASPNILEDINLKVEAGESIAITGPSGAGKSTLLKIMLRLNTPQAGEVCIDDIPLNKLGSQQYRDQIAAVMQNDELLSGSIADNIAFFDQRIDMERVYKCAKLAFIDADINNMPMSYNSLIGDMGSSLSGGQKQRVLLARALYKKPRILFMDEATSHLDSSLESDINRAIKALDITRVIIAHRKETIESADKIVKVL
nr:ATP-binding cassette domain-containing protein [Pseudoalteromonas sp. 0303]